MLEETSLENINTKSNLLTNGKSVMKSMEIDGQGKLGMRSGSSILFDRWRATLDREQASHALMIL